jgi:sulfur-carrier protein adenylyltransferase/sulfurtransferase
MNSSQRYERYSRQTILKGFDLEAQQKLTDAKVLMIGAGGLGCPALQYLAAAGAGTIGIVDDDVVSLSNLHRQILFNMTDIGFSKAIKAQEKLEALNPEITVIAYNERLANKNALDIIAGYDIIIDGTDNFATRYLINDACVLLNKPLVYGAVSQFEGQVAVFNFQKEDGTPQPPTEDEVQNCAEAGVLGILPGIIGTMQANETIKLITGIGKSLIGSILTYNALTNQVYEIALTTNETARQLIPTDREIFMQTDYEWLCSSRKKYFEIDAESFDKLIAEKNIAVIDVREAGELPMVNNFAHPQIPLSKINEQLTKISTETIVLFCQTGKRSAAAAKNLLEKFGSTKKIYSLHGGIINWMKEKQTQQA